MGEESWNVARLIPTSGINGADEQERRATSALLAVIAAVKEFGRAITQPLGAPAGSIETFIEVPFTLGDRRLYPDGLIRVVRGSREWTALVEVKTGSNELQADQLGDYLDVAREQGLDAVVTISNQVTALAGQHPTAIDKRKLRRVSLHHYPWTQVLTEAVVQKEHRGVADPDQAWILGELIRYLEHPRSGAMEFEDMGSSWVPVREAIAAGTLRTTDKGVNEVASRFDALLRFASLRLGRQLGREVTPALSRRELSDPTLRSQLLVSELCSAGKLAGSIKIPDAVAALDVCVDLRAGQITCSVDIAAPREGRSTTRVNWLVRQLKDAPETTRLEAFAMHGRGASSAALLRDVRSDAGLLIADSKKDLRAFRVAVVSPMGLKRGNGRGSFIDSVIKSTDDFYTHVLQRMKAWSAAPPRIRQEGEVEQTPGPSSLSSVALSSQDGGEQDRDESRGSTAIAVPQNGGEPDSTGNMHATVGDGELRADSASSMIHRPLTADSEQERSSPAQ